LFHLIDRIDVIIEKQYLKEKITEYLDKNEEGQFQKLEKLKGVRGNRKKITYNGKEYESITKFLKEYGIPDQSYYQYVRQGLTLDEIVNKYTSGKCLKTREATVLYEYAGQQLSLNELEKLSGIKKNTIYQRMLNGWSVADAVETPVIEKGERRANNEER
jgi:hypothetical protein